MNVDISPPLWLCSHGCVHTGSKVMSQTFPNRYSNVCCCDSCQSHLPLSITMHYSFVTHMSMCALLYLYLSFTAGMANGVIKHFMRGNP